MSKYVAQFSKALQRLPFGSHPGLLFCPQLEGYRYFAFGGRAFVDEKTTQSIERELRTFAHQYHLLRAAGEKVQLKTYSRSKAEIMKLMPNWLLLPVSEDSLEQEELDRKALCARRIVEYVEAYNPADTIARVTSWLDQVQRDLKKIKSVMADAKAQFTRTLYRGDGSVFAVTRL